MEIWCADVFLVGAIDPGKSGGWALYNRTDRDLLLAGRIIHDNPLIVTEAMAGCRIILIERAQASNQMGKSSAFEYGRTFGRIECAAMATGATILYCAPVWWKSKLAVPTDKKAAVEKALKTIPGLDRFINLASDDGVAEAALIGQILIRRPLYEQLVKNNEARQKPKRKRPSFRL